MQPSFAHDAQVAGVQPAVGLNHLRRAFRIAVVALHQREAVHADFALLADGHDLSPVSRETILISVCGMARPTVLTRISIESLGVAHRADRRGFRLAVGDDQLAAVHLFITRFISSTGQGAPLIMPVRRLVRSKLLKSGSANSATYMAGTP